MPSPDICAIVKEILRSFRRFINCLDFQGHDRVYPQNLTMKRFTVVFIVTAVALAFVFRAAGHYFGLSLPGVLAWTTRALFPPPNANGFYGQSDLIYSAIIFFIFCAFVMLTGMHSVVFLSAGQKCRPFRIKLYMRDAAAVLLTVSLVIVSCQTAGHVRWFSKNVVHYSGMEETEKKRLIMGIPFEFARLCKMHMRDGYYNGRLITDMNLSTSQGMTLQRRLAYYLLPIRIRFNPERQEDYLIYFDKRNAEDLLPDDYVPRLKIGERFLFAVREDLL